ncbi:AraC family transcriptional regulator [Sphingopyxis sp. J-6]|uniref:helix-turn-helix transcriptional regulator n=1 Tax=Sphingopyxis sp. J-6 TaxID=3122054 RepID=UPI00398421F1
MQQAIPPGSGAQTAAVTISPLARGRKSLRVTAAAARRRFPVDADTLPAVSVEREVPDFLGDEDPERIPGVETFTQLGHPGHFRVHGLTDHAFGHFEFCRLDDGFFAGICDTTYLEPLATTMVADNMLRVIIASEGDGEYATARGEIVDFKGPGAAIIVEPAGQPPAETVFFGRNLGVHLYIHCDALKRLYAGEEGDLPALLRAFIAGSLPATVARRLPLTPQLLRFLEDLKGCTLEGRSRRLLIQSKAIEILCHAFEALDQDENGETFAGASKLAASGVLKAQRLLSDNFVSPPSLDDLAHQVGLSRSGLCAAFRQIVGQTVFDYIADLRMQQALALLNESGATISEVAYAVGYGHPSSFSVAVQRRFGTTASELRRRGLPAA